MDSIEARKIVVKVNNYYKNTGNILTKELEKEVHEMCNFIVSNLLVNMADIFENSIFDNQELLTIVKDYLDKDMIYKILKSTKLRNVFSNQEILIFWNKLTDKQKVTYIKDSRSIYHKDNFLVLQLIDDCLISFEEVKDKFEDNTLDIDITVAGDMTSFMRLATIEKITNFLSKNPNECRILFEENNQDLWNLIPENSLYFTEDVSSLRELFEENALINKLHYSVVAGWYGINKLLEMVKDNQSKTILGAIYYQDKLKFKKVILEIFSDLKDNFLPMNCYDLLHSNFKFKTKHSLLFKFESQIVSEIIVQYYKPEEIVDLLRNKDFVSFADETIIKNAMSALPFKVVFNLLQDNGIYNKTGDLVFSVSGDEKTLITGFLDSLKLIKKIDRSMYYRLLSMLNYDEVSVYIVKPYILSKLTDDEIVDLLSIKNISIRDLMTNEEFFKRINKTLLINYVNKMWEVNTDLSLIGDYRLIKIIFDLEDADLRNIRIEDVNYLFTTIQNKEYLANVKSKINILSYKAVIIAYKLFGISNTLKILFNGLDKITLEDVKKFEEKYVNDKVNCFLKNDGILIDKLDVTITKLLDECQVKLSKDSILKNKALNSVVMLLININIDLKTILKQFNRYIEYAKIDKDVATKELIDYLNEIKDLWISKKQNEYKKEFINHALKFIKLKENIQTEEIKKQNNNTLYNIKFKLLYAVYNDDNDYRYLFRKNISYKKKLNDFKKYIENSGFDFKEYLENILLPLSDESFDINKYLTSKGIKCPENFDEYLEIIAQEEAINNLNKKFIKLAYSLESSKLSDIANYLLYGTKTKILSKYKKDIDICKNLISELNFEIYYDVNNNQFLATNIVNAYKDIDCENYFAKYNNIKIVISNTRKFVKNNFVNKVIYKYYYSKFENNDLEDKVISLDLNDYVIKPTIFTINDLEDLLAGFNIKDTKTLEDDYINLLVELKLLPMMLSKLISGNRTYILSESEILKKYVSENGLLLNRVSVLDLLNIWESLFKDDYIFNNTNQHYYEFLNIEALNDCYRNWIKNSKKYLTNINYVNQEYSLGDIHGFYVINNILNLNKRFHCVINIYDLLKDIDNSKKTFLEIRKNNIVIGLLMLEVKGNCVIVNKPIVSHKNTIDLSIISGLAKKLLDENKYIDFVFSSDSNGSLTKFNDYYVLGARKELFNKYIDNSYYGKLNDLINPEYEMVYGTISNNILKRIKLNYYLNNIDDLETFNNYERIVFDNYNVVVYKEGKIYRSINKNDD